MDRCGVTKTYNETVKEMNELLQETAKAELERVKNAEQEKQPDNVDEFKKDDRNLN